MESFLKNLLNFVLAICLVGCASVRPHARKGFFRDLASRGHSARGTTATAVAFERKSLALLKHEDHGLVWPLDQVIVTSGFGKRGSESHEGVDLKAKTGTPVYAAQSGVVVYAGHGIRGYGNLVVIRHREGLATVYAHNSVFKVSKGQKVLQGSLIALSGATGNVRGPHLHFEIRTGVQAVDPMTLNLGKRAVILAERSSAPGGLRSRRKLRASL